jgi:hypothetical protein
MIIFKILGITMMCLVPAVWLLDGITNLAVCWFNYVSCSGKKFELFRLFSKILNKPMSMVYGGHEITDIHDIIISTFPLILGGLFIGIIICATGYIPPVILLSILAIPTTTLLIRVLVWGIKTIRRLAKIAHSHADTTGIKLDKVV